MDQTPTISLERMEELMPLIREILQKGSSVRFFPRGISMLPMLRQDIDSVVLSPLPDRLQKYDLPLYRRENGKYILHRIVGAGDTYVCIGDNQFVCEHGVRREQMIGLVTGFYRGETYHSVDEPAYKLYCRFWHHSRPLRHFWRRGVGYLRRRFK